MKQLKCKRFFFYCFLLCACLIGGQAGAAIAPDPGIHADLNELFNNPPQVRGYPFQQLLEKAASKYGLPIPFVLAVVRGESFFDPKAKSVKGALGLMQVMPSTAADYGFKPEDLLDPATNIDAGVHYLADLYSRLQDPYLTLAAYYCGCGGVDSENATIRKDCDEYVRYIHTHLQKILVNAEGKVLASPGEVKSFVLARFDNFLDARSFLGYISQRLPSLQLDLFRHEVVQVDHARYQYQILAACKEKTKKDEICRAVEDATGFSFCR